MFKYWAIKKYGDKLHKKLQQRYGVTPHYSAHQIRATVYQGNFNPEYLPLGYILYLEHSAINAVFAAEFPEIAIQAYKNELLSYLDSRKDNSLVFTLKSSSVITN